MDNLQKNIVSTTFRLVIIIIVDKNGELGFPFHKTGYDLILSPQYKQLNIELSSIQIKYSKVLFLLKYITKKLQTFARASPPPAHFFSSPSTSNSLRTTILDFWFCRL